MNDQIGQYNQSVKKSIEQKHGKTLQEIYHSPAGRELIGLFQCVCGKMISPFMLNKFKFTVETVVCYDCWSGNYLSKLNSEAKLAIPSLENAGGQTGTIEGGEL